MLFYNYSLVHQPNQKKTMKSQIIITHQALNRNPMRNLISFLLKLRSTRFCRSLNILQWLIVIIYKRIIIISFMNMEVITNKMHPLACGANSQIYLYGEGDAKVILKAVNTKAVKESKHLANQYSILKQLDHQNIISVLKYKQNVQMKLLSDSQPSYEETNEQTGMENHDQKEHEQLESKTCNILVLEHAQHGSFLDLVKKVRLQIRQTRELFIQVAEALEFLHCKYIVHRDLKLDNVFISSNDGILEAKLGDFGFATSCYNPDKSSLIQFNSFKGTKRGYMAPEIHQVLNDPTRYYDARKSDIFALGVMLFAAIFGSLPFESATTQNRLYKLIVQEKYEQFWRHHQRLLTKMDGVETEMIGDFKQLFEGMVCRDPNKRFTIQDVLESEWVNGERMKTRAPKF